jgi:hypothetical protein
MSEKENANENEIDYLRSNVSFVDDAYGIGYSRGLGCGHVAGVVWAYGYGYV